MIDPSAWQRSTQDYAAGMVELARTPTEVQLEYINNGPTCECTHLRSEHMGATPMPRLIGYDGPCTVEDCDCTKYDPVGIPYSMLMTRELFVEQEAIIDDLREYCDRMHRDGVILRILMAATVIGSAASVFALRHKWFNGDPAPIGVFFATLALVNLAVTAHFTWKLHGRNNTNTLYRAQ